MTAAAPRSDRQLGLLWGAVALALVLASPLAPLLARGVGSCPFKEMTGVPCPTCGTTRAAVALAGLEPLEALQRYPLPTIAWTLFLAGGLWAGARALRGLPLPRLPRRVPGWAKVTLVGAVLLNWVFSILTGV